MVFTAGDYKTIDFVRIGVFLQVRFSLPRNILLLGCTAHLGHIGHCQILGSWMCESQRQS
jgi:hypothetical protein